MNHYSKWVAGVALGVVASTTVGCGGDSDDATTKAGWTEKHGAAVKAVSGDIDSSRSALSGGQRPDILASCNQLEEDLASARKGLPVPDPSSDAALRKALDTTSAGAADCLQGARIANQAAITEKGIAELRDARGQLDDAQKAIDAWR
jgi:hypothetical protein